LQASILLEENDDNKGGRQGRQEKEQMGGKEKELMGGK
jgi:hypothetical protein